MLLHTYICICIETHIYICKQIYTYMYLYTTFNSSFRCQIVRELPPFVRHSCTGKKSTETDAEHLGAFWTPESKVEIHSLLCCLASSFDCACWSLTCTTIWSFVHTCKRTILLIEIPIAIFRVPQQKNLRKKLLLLSTLSNNKNRVTYGEQRHVGGIKFTL